MPTADGAVWIDVLPSMKGFAPALRAQTAAASNAAGKSSGLGFGKKFAAAAAGAMAALSVGAALKSSIDKAGQFDKTMRIIGVTTGQTGDQMKELTSLALDMGAKTVFSAQDASEAMLALSKGGLTAAQIKAGALQQTLTLASAGGLELGSAADYMVQGLTTFGLAADQANVVAAALAGGANASTASVESMGMALSQVGPSAKLAGLSIQETTGALAAFDNAGVKGSDAGTSLKTMLMNLTPSTAAAAAKMKDLHLKFTDAHGAFLPLRDIAGQLQGAMKGLSAEEQTTALKTMFGADAFRAAAILAKEGAAGVDKFTAATSDLGAAQRLADEGTKGYAGAMEQFKGAVETAQIQLGTKLLPAVTDFLNFVTNTALPGVESFARKIGKLVGWFRKYQDIIVPVAAGVGSFTVVLNAARIATLLYTGVTRVVTTVTRGWAIAQGILNAVMAANPFVLVAALVVGLGVAFIVAYKKSETFRNAIGAAWKFIRNAFVTGVKFVVNIFLGFVETLLNGAAKAFGWIPGIGPKLKKAAADFKEFRQDVNRQLDAIKDKDVKVGVELDKGAQQAINQFGKNTRLSIGLDNKGHLSGVHVNGGTQLARAKGGPIGRGVGTRDEVPVLAMRGEHMWTTREVAAVGGHGAMMRLRKLALAGAFGAYGGGLDVHTDFPSAAARQRLIGRIRETRDAAGRAVDGAVTRGLSAYINARAKAMSAGAGATYMSGPLGSVVFPLPRGSYRVGVPLGGYPGHTGQDFPAPIGTPVYAPFAGSFQPRALGNRSYGNMANVYGAAGLRFIGGHLSSFARGPGYVRAGELIGRVGSTGNSTGPHLHAEFRRNGGVINPHSVLSFDGGGVLPPGLSTVLNGTGRPEAVFTPQQLASLSKAAASQPPHVRVFIGDRELTDIVRVEQDRRDAALTDGLTYRPV